MFWAIEVHRWVSTLSKTQKKWVTNPFHFTLLSFTFPVFPLTFLVSILLATWITLPFSKISCLNVVLAFEEFADEIDARGFLKVGLFIIFNIESRRCWSFILLKSIDPLDIIFWIISVILLLNPTEPGWLELSIHADKSREPPLAFPPLTLLGAIALLELPIAGPQKHRWVKISNRLVARQKD